MPCACVPSTHWHIPTHMHTSLYIHIDGHTDTNIDTYSYWRTQNIHSECDIYTHTAYVFPYEVVNGCIIHVAIVSPFTANLKVNETFVWSENMVTSSIITYTITTELVVPVCNVSDKILCYVTLTPILRITWLIYVAGWMIKIATTSKWGSCIKKHALWHC